MKKMIILFLLLWGFEAQLHGQSSRSYQLTFAPMFGDSALVLGKILNADSLQITAFRFYMSDCQLFNNNQRVWTEPNNYHLIDAEKPASCQLTFQIPTDLVFDSLVCHLGIDSLTNTEGAKSGDLDPMHGMYWAWQSGYINFKLEGASRLCPSRKKQFQFHLGGFLGDDYALQTLGFSLKKPSDTTHNSQLITHNSKNREGGVLRFDVAQFLSTIDFKMTNHIMSPSVKAVGLAEKAASVFVLSF